MKAESLKHQVRQRQGVRMEHAIARKDDEAIRLLDPVLQAGDAMLAQEVDGIIDTKWVEVFWERREAAAAKRPDLQGWFGRTPDYYLSSHP